MSKKKLVKYIIDNAKLDKDIEELDKMNNTFSWLVEFSKKVVFAAFIVFLLSTGAIVTLLFLNYFNGDMTGFDTFIVETNSTFKIVVAGYCVKAAFENVVKISANKKNKLVELKDKILKDQVTKESGIKFDDSDCDNDGEGNFDSLSDDDIE